MQHYCIQHKKEIFHFWNQSQDGIFLRRKNTCGSWREKQRLSPILRKFCPLSDGEHLHLVGINEQNELLYLLFKNNSWTQYRLTSLTADFRVTRILLHRGRQFLHLFCTAHYHEELLLIHCVLGNHAQPEPIAKLADDAICIFRDHIYYTNADGILGKQEITDGKPLAFLPIAEHAYMPEVRICGKEHVIYCRDGNILFDGRPAAKDRDAGFPVLFEKDHRLVLLWKSGAYLRYTLSADDGETWNPPMRFLQSGQSAELFYIQTEHSLLRSYAYENGAEIRFFGNADPFSAPVPAPSVPPPPFESEKLRIHLELLQKEVTSLKQQLILLQKNSENQEEISLS